LAAINKNGSELTFNDNKSTTLRLNRPLRILIADDTPTNLIILEDLLQEAGHEVVTVADGSDLVQQLAPMIEGDTKANRFDIVLTDISMPIMDGYEATRKIRKLEQAANTPVHVPIIAITAHAISEEQSRMREAGVDGIVTKPIRAEALAAEVERLLGANL
jgi:CheY-like chemotaxis protein